MPYVELFSSSRARVCGLGLCALVGSWAGPAAAVEASRSAYRVPVANGFAVASFSGSPAGIGVVDRWSDRVYQQRSPTDGPVRDLLYDAYFGLRVDGASTWLTAYTELRPELAHGFIEVERQQGSLVLIERVWAPMGLALPATVHTLRVENRGAAVATGVSLQSLHNLHLGEDWGDGAGAVRNERLSGGAGTAGLVEWGADNGLVMHVLPLVPTDAAGCVDVWSRFTAGGALDRSCAGSGDDQVGSLGWDIGALEPGESRSVGFVLAFSSGFDTASAPPAVEAWRAGLGPDALLEREIADWDVFLAESPPPAGTSADEQQAWRAALATLRMAQVREPGDPYGQLVASFPNSNPVGDFQHEWNIAWVRDGSYAARALAEIGQPEAALDALRFLLQDEKNGLYAALIGVDDYAVSVCRSYGDGTEWSDEDATGPNVELDNFGLVLWAAGGVFEATGDIEALRPLLPALLDGVADVLLASIDPTTGLIQPDSSIWERHWNGNQRSFTYTSAFAVAGLEAAAVLAEAAGDGRGAAYRAGAAEVAAGVAAHLIHPEGYVAANLEDLQRGLPVLDLAAVEVFNLGLLSAGSAEAAASFDAWEGLRVAHGRGFMRNDDGDLYDRHEWAMVDLRLAEAFRRACRPEEAAALEGWITEQARENHWMIPELYHPETGVYAGPVPMLGFGGGLYLLQLQRRAALDAGCEAFVDTGGDGASDGPGDGGGAGEGAADGGGADAGASDGGPDTLPDGSEDTAPLDAGKGSAEAGCGGCGAAPGARWAWGWALAAGLAALRRRGAR